MAQYKQGQSGNPAGRPKGSKNRNPEQVRKLLTDTLSGHLEKIPEYLEALESPKEKLDALAKFLPYIAQRLQATEYHERQSVEDFLKMSQEERTARIAELRSQLNKAS